MRDLNRRAVEDAWHPTILIAPAAPEHFDHEDFSDLVRQLVLVQRTGIKADEIQWRLGYLYGDYFPPEWEWINVVLDEVGKRALDAIVAAIMAWGFDRFRRKREQEAEPKPIKAVIYGPNGEILREVEAREEAEEPRREDR